jgi:hypothetical protein
LRRPILGFEGAILALEAVIYQRSEDMALCHVDVSIGEMAWITVNFQERTRERSKPSLIIRGQRAGLIGCDKQASILRHPFPARRSGQQGQIYQIE